MDEKTVFNTQPNTGASDPNGDQSGQRLSMQDLYGPSTQNVPQQQGYQQAPQDYNQQMYEQQYQQTNVNEQQPVQSSGPNQNATDYYDQGTAQQPAYPQQGVYTNAMPPSSSSGNRVLKIIAGVVGGFLLLAILIGIVSRLFPSKPKPPYENTTITYWGLWEENKTMQPIINDFEKKYPGIKVVYKKQDKDKYKERLLTRIENNSDAPDVFTFHNTWVPTLTNSSENILLPLPSDVITPDEFKKIYYPVIQRDMSNNGAIYGLPQGIDTLALFINKGIFDDGQINVPQTWYEFNTAAKTLTVKDKDRKIKTAGAAMGTYDNITHIPDVISLLFTVNGINLEKIDTQKDLLKELFEWYSSFANGNENVWDNTMGQSRDAFASNELAMYFGYSWDIFAIKAMNSDLQFEVHPVPYLPENNNAKKVTIASYWANGVSNKTKHQKEALLFLKYLAEKDTVQKLYTESSKTRLFGQPYARTDLANTLADNPLVYPFVQQAEYATSSYFASDTYDRLYNEPLNEILGNTIRSINGIPSDTVIDTFFLNVNEIRSKALQ